MDPDDVNESIDKHWHNGSIDASKLKKLANQRNREIQLILEQFEAFQQEMRRKISTVEQKLDNDKETKKQQEEEANNKNEETEEERKKKDSLNNHQPTVQCINSSQATSSANSSKLNKLFGFRSPMIIGLLLLIVLLVGGTLLNLSAPPTVEKATILQSDMPYDMQKEALRLAKDSFRRLHATGVDNIAALIKDEFDKKYGSFWHYWHCVVSDTFIDYQITYRKGSSIGMSIVYHGKVFYILLWKK